jgi:hypothetical protein
MKKFQHTVLCEHLQSLISINMKIRFNCYYAVDAANSYLGSAVDKWAQEYNIKVTQDLLRVAYTITLGNECDYTTFALTWNKFLDDYHHKNRSTYWYNYTIIETV